MLFNFAAARYIRGRMFPQSNVIHSWGLVGLRAPCGECKDMYLSLTSCSAKPNHYSRTSWLFTHCCLTSPAHSLIKSHARSTCTLSVLCAPIAKRRQIIPFSIVCVMKIFSFSADMRKLSARFRSFCAERPSGLSGATEEGSFRRKTDSAREGVVTSSKSGDARTSEAKCSFNSTPCQTVKSVLVRRGG